MNIVLIGVGQTLRGDDGVGPAVVKAWKEFYPTTFENPQIRTEIEELPGLNLLSLLQGSDAAIIVDAVHSNNKPGILHLIHNDTHSPPHEITHGAHNLGVQETLGLARLLQADNLPESITIIGIEVENVELGGNLSNHVQEAIPEAVDIVEQQLQLFLQNIPE